MSGPNRTREPIRVKLVSLLVGLLLPLFPPAKSRGETPPPVDQETINAAMERLKAKAASRPTVTTKPTTGELAKGVGGVELTPLMQRRTALIESLEIRRKRVLEMQKQIGKLRAEGGAAPSAGELRQQHEQAEKVTREFAKEKLALEKISDEKLTLMLAEIDEKEAARHKTLREKFNDPRKVADTVIAPLITQGVIDSAQFVCFSDMGENSVTKAPLEIGGTFKMLYEFQFTTKGGFVRRSRGSMVVSGHSTEGWWEPIILNIGGNNGLVGTFDVLEMKPWELKWTGQGFVVSQGH